MLFWTHQSLYYHKLFLSQKIHGVISCSSMSLSNYRELWSLESCSHFYVILGMALIGKKQLFLFGRGCEVLWHCHFHCRSRQVQLHYFFIYFCLFCSGPFFFPLILYLLWGMWVKISAELQPKSLAQASPFLLSCMLVCLYQFCAVASIFVLIKQIKFFMHEWLSLKFLKLVVFWSRVPWHSTTFVVGEE